MKINKTVYALGFFDGVHLGHQALLAEARRLATSLGGCAGAVTFDVPPSAFLRNQDPNMINTLPDRVALLRDFGMEKVEMIPCNAESLSTPWCDFLEKLVDIGAAGFVCGHDFRFGHRGEGTAQRLAEFAERRNIPCTIIPEQLMDGARISSTAIRALLEAGEMEKANRLLGHPHRLSGMVAPGKQLGRTIGIPTANLTLPPQLLQPAFGVYACKVLVEGNRHTAVTNIGVRPTVSGRGVTVESWLLDFEGDLYGKELVLEFFKFLRPEKAFDSLEALQNAIQADAEHAKTLLL